MALWKPFKGNRTSLDATEKHDGYVYFCIDDGSLFFDYVDSDGNLQRKQISAKDAETIMGKSLDELKEFVTPVKGVDYYTDDDINEVVSRVIDAIPNAEGVSF